MLMNMIRSNAHRLCLVHRKSRRNCLPIQFVFSSSSSSSSLDKVELGMKRLIDRKQYREALHLYGSSLHTPTEISSTLALKACAKLRDHKLGVRIHQQLSSDALGSSFLQTSLIHFYMQCHKVAQAEAIFSNIAHKTTFMYGAMLKGYASNGSWKEMFRLFDQMSIKPNSVIFTILLNACAALPNDEGKKRGRQALQHLPQAFLTDINLMNAAIDMLMRFGDVEHAEQIFHSMKEKNDVTYGSIMKGYVINHMAEKALDLVEKLPFKPNRTLHVIIYNACASAANERAANLAKKILDEMPREYLDDVILLSSAAHMHMKFGDVTNAERLFSRTREATLVTYGVMINGYKINHQPRKSLQILDEINRRKMVLKEVESVALVNACAQIGLMSTCQRILKYIPPHLHQNVRVASSLIDMWGKAGAVHEANRIYNSISDKDSFIYTAMLNGYGRNGMGVEALEVYRQMPTELQNIVTHVCILNACSHSGFVDEAENIFSTINDRSSYVVTTMVDCYSRMSMFEDAQKLIDQYEQSHSPYVVMYMAALSGARNHRRPDLAQKLFDRMKPLFPQHRSDLVAASILLANVYSATGDHGQAQQIRNDRLKSYGVKVTPGIAWTEVDDELVEFRAHGYHDHRRANEIRSELERMAKDLRDDGHQFDSSWVIRPLEEEETIESVLCGHSEKLAIAYNFIQKPPLSIIQVTKNLRVCGDCHEATKRLARIRQVDIIVRDANRIHHFHKNGQCSCQDHF